MIASLPMYDRPETRAATDRFWQATRDGLRARGVEAPDALSRDQSLIDVWTSPDLVLSQTCGLPFRKLLSDKVTVIARPDFGLPDTAPGDYRSVIVTVARTGLNGTLTAGINDELSQSGWAALRDWCAFEGYAIALKTFTGSHLASARAVADGVAQVAAIDAQTWRLIQRYEPWARGLSELARTPPMPGLPYITRAAVDPAPYLAALSDAVNQLNERDREVLSLHGIVPASARDYHTVPDPDTRPPI